ncbi:MAG: peptidase S41, partial [Bacteroidia bacterium]|nr:peptidase S41 [Bacteroidia bacterium]
KYITPGGKVVYGGGGIVPDVFVPVDTAKYSTIVNRMYYTGTINSFAFEYTDKKRSILLSKFKTANDFNMQFKVGTDVLQEFSSYVNSKSNNSQISANGKQLIGIELILKSLIGRNLFDKDGYYPNLNEHDNCILKAIEVLK